MSDGMQGVKGINSIVMYNNYLNHRLYNGLFNVSVKIRPLIQKNSIYLLLNCILLAFSLFNFDASGFDEIHYFTFLLLFLLFCSLSFPLIPLQLLPDPASLGPVMDIRWGSGYHGYMYDHRISGSSPRPQAEYLYLSRLASLHSFRYGTPCSA